MKMKKILALVMALTLSSVMVTGCGGDTDKDQSKGGNTTGGEKQTLKVAALESAYGADVWKEVVKAFEEEKGNVTVDLTIDKSLETVISAKMKAGEYPDFVHLATGRPDALTETLIKDNGLLAIDDVFDMTVPGESKTVSEKLIPGFRDSSIIKPYSDGKTYMAPMFYSPAGLFYNAGLLKEKGWEVPTTWDQMWELGDKAKAEGIALFTYPTSGYFDAFSWALLANIGGPDFLKKVTSYEEGIWDTAEGAKYLEIMGKLAEYTEKNTVANANNTNYLKNQQLILDNKAIFMPNGTWVIGEMEEAPKAEGFEWETASIPRVNESDEQYITTFFEQCWIPAASENQDLAKEFMAFMYSDKAAQIFANYGAVQPIQGASAMIPDSRGEKSLYAIYDTPVNAITDGGFATTDAVEGVSIADSWFSAYDSVVSGSKTVEEWKAGIVEASDKLRPALK